MVPCLSLEDVFECTCISHCNLLKIDSEGAEYAILFNTPSSILSRIERIVMEYHDKQAGFIHTDLEQFLVELGFDVQTYANYVHSHIGYLFASR